MLVSDLPIPGVGAGLLGEPDPGTPLRAGVVALHGASSPDRSQPLFDHLADTLTPLGYAVLSYDRRTSEHGGDVPLTAQSDDARSALSALAAHLDVPVGLYAFSQGAWAACLAAAADADADRGPRVAFLALLGCSGVTPALQMRFYTDELLRRSGHGEEVRARALALRVAFEDALRGDGDRAGTSAALTTASVEPWFDLVYLPPEMPPPEMTWDDMDFDPAPSIARVTCPTLLMYGAEEECVPAPASIAVWRSHGARDLTVVELPGCGHVPVVGGAGLPEPADTDSLSPDYTAALTVWFASPRSPSRPGTSSST